MDERIIFKLMINMLDNGIEPTLTKHASLRMLQRNITYNDVLDILRNPNYIKKEEESKIYNSKFNYRIMGKHEWSVVISIDFPNSVFIITVID